MLNKSLCYDTFVKMGLNFITRKMEKLILLQRLMHFHF